MKLIFRFDHVTLAFIVLQKLIIFCNIISAILQQHLKNVSLS